MKNLKVNPKSIAKLCSKFSLKKIVFKGIIALAILATLSAAIDITETTIVTNGDFVGAFRTSILSQKIISEEEKGNIAFIHESLLEIFPDIRFEENVRGFFDVENNNGESAYYRNGIITINKTYYSYADIHEIIHAFSDHGFYIGFMHKYTHKARAINEGMTEYLTRFILGDMRDKKVYVEHTYIGMLQNIISINKLGNIYFEKTTKDLEKEIVKYTDKDLISEMDNDYLKNKNVKSIIEHIIDMHYNKMTNERFDKNENFNMFLSVCYSTQYNSIHGFIGMNDRDEIKDYFLSKLLLLNISLEEKMELFNKYENFFENSMNMNVVFPKPNIINHDTKLK